MKKQLLFACLLIAGCATKPTSDTVKYRAVNIETGITDVVTHECKNASLAPFNKLEPVRVNRWGEITQDTTDAEYIILNQMQ